MPAEVQWFDDHVIDEDGRQYALEVPWRSEWAGENLPEICKSLPMYTGPLTDSYRGGNAADWQLRERERRAQIRAERKARSKKSLAAMKGKHPDEHYDRKLKQWVKNEDVQIAEQGSGPPGPDD